MADGVDYDYDNRIGNYFAVQRGLDFGYRLALDFGYRLGTDFYDGWCEKIGGCFGNKTGNRHYDSLGDNFDGDCDGQLLNIFAYFCRNRDLRVGLI